MTGATTDVEMKVQSNFARALPLEKRDWGTLRTVHVKMEDPKRNYSTSINGTDEEIRDYFVGKHFNLVDDEMFKCVDVVIE